jgi:ribosomal protein S18 acetylase RimI-like enzyme
MALDSSTRSAMALRPGTEADAATAAALHSGQITEGFLTFLGPTFLRRLYRRIARSPESFLLIVDDDVTPVGFLAGSSDVSTLYRSFVWRDGPAAALACSGRLLRSWRRAWETFRHGATSAGQGAELLAVAVDSAAQGRGGGSLLVEGFLADIARRGQSAAYVVVAADNETAVALYRRAGFRVAERFSLHAGTESLLMQWTASPAVVS